MNWDIVFQIIEASGTIAILIYVIYTAKLARTNKQLVEYTTRPVAGVLVSPTSEATRLNIRVRNYSSTHAMGLVRVKLFADNKEISLQDPAYEGEELWYFPARQTVQGNHPFSGRLQAHEISESRLNLKIVIFVYYKIWSHRNTEVNRADKLYAPVSTWEFKHDFKTWIPVLTSPAHEIPPEPDWEIFEKQTVLS